jgi:Predicted glycosyltransferases
VTDGFREDTAEAIADLKRQVKALRREASRQACDLSRVLPRFFRPADIPACNGDSEKPVDILLTVKNSYDFLQPCLESIFANTDVPFRLVISDNNSSDPRTPEFLKQVRDEHAGKVQLFLQETDLGYAGGVNFLLSHSANDAILVNADVVVPPGWASRLLWPIRHSGKKVASAAPFTNAASMIAFPDVFLDDILFDDMSLERLDKVFQAARPTASFAFPYSPGFCMALSRSAVEEVGLFDAATFSPIYGEEVDWCCRATRKGYSHLLAANVFVYHKHGGTMRDDPSVERERLREKHARIIEARYPWYSNAVMDFIDNPELLAFRSMLTLLASTEVANGCAVFFSSRDAAARTRCFRRAGEARAAIVVSQDPDTGRGQVTYRFKRHHGAFEGPGVNWAIKLLYRLKISEIVVDDLSGWDHVPMRTLHTLQRLRRFSGAPLSVVLNNHYPVCPAWRLRTPDGRDCGVPADTTACAPCLARQAHSPDYPVWPDEFIRIKKYTWLRAEDLLAWDGTADASFGQWRGLVWGRFLRECADSIIVPARADAALLERVYPGVEDKIVFESGM